MGFDIIEIHLVISKRIVPYNWQLCRLDWDMKNINQSLSPQLLNLKKQFFELEFDQSKDKGMNELRFYQPEPDSECSNLNLKTWFGLKGTRILAEVQNFVSTLLKILLFENWRLQALEG